MIERHVFALLDDGEMMDPGLWEPAPFASFDIAVDSWVEVWEETSGPAVVVEREPLRAVIVVESDAGESGTFVLLGVEVP